MDTSFRMEVSRWPKKIYQWIPHGRRRRGRQQQSWKSHVDKILVPRMTFKMKEQDSLGA